MEHECRCPRVWPPLIFVQSHMRLHAGFVIVLAAALSLCSAGYRPDLGKKLGFLIYTNNPPGKQLSGPHAPATTPALSPNESRKQIMVPPGFEVRLFAS